MCWWLMRTDGKPAWRNDMTLALLLQVDCNPEWYFRFVRRPKGTIRALSPIDQRENGFQVIKVDRMKGIRSCQVDICLGDTTIKRLIAY